MFFRNWLLYIVKTKELPNDNSFELSRLVNHFSPKEIMENLCIGNVQLKLADSKITYVRTYAGIKLLVFKSILPPKNISKNNGC